MPTLANKELADEIFKMTNEKTKAELINFIEKQTVIIKQLRSLDEPEEVEDSYLLGVCPACTKITNQMESPYRCRYCGKSLIWKGDKS